MKKILLVAVLFMATVCAQAQSGLGIGLRGGLNYANATGDGADDNSEYKFGAHAGLTFHYDLSEMVGLKLETIYSNKGYKYESDVRSNGIDVETDINTALSYIDVPLLANVKAGPLFFEVGPQLSFLITGKDKFKQKTRDSNGNEVAGFPDRDEERDIEDLYENVDFGYAAGLGWMSDAGFGVGLRYNGGIKSFTKSSSGNNDKWRHSVFQLSLMYRFGANN
ncbi:MAG: PorT family protein [Hymenobacteraceae bacterium]|nr:PorT family protein [Hymenobacteraceae bacterium]MDX5396394.1 PorT family protein [Hymenobacteraceae bacterium]MDX5512456.1 PorT family protein [Hymenobacteraceae bacterium]